MADISSTIKANIYEDCIVTAMAVAVAVPQPASDVGRFSAIQYCIVCTKEIK